MSKLKYYDGTNWKVVNGQITGDTLPIGAIVPYGSATAPTNWLVCDGSAVSRTTYAELFAVIGTSFGSGDGSTTFNLPNLKGRVAVGQDTTQTEFDTMGETGGSKYLQEHSHIVKYDNDASFGGSAPRISVSGSSTDFSTNTSGTGDSGNLQPYQVVCYIIKAKQSAGLVANVSNAATSSTTDTYSCDYINGALNGTLLYLSTGEATTITLNEDIDNYNYVEVYYYTNDSGSMCCKKAQINKNATTLMCLDFTYNTGILYYKMANVSISNTTILFNNNAQMVLGTDTSPTSGTYIYIFKVIGYK